MFKRYEYHSKLSPAQVFARMEVHQRNVKRTGKVWDWERWRYVQWMEYRRKKENGFSLYMSNAREVFVAFPFVGTVEPAEEGSMIRGGFAMWGDNLRTFLIFWGVPAGMAMLMTGSVVLSMIMNLLSAFFLSAVCWLVGRITSEPVLNYIQENLLEP